MQLLLRDMATWALPALLEPPFIFVVLNTPIRDETGFKALWKLAERRILVDGGANSYNKVLIQGQDDQMALPDVISGDFDSIDPDLLRQFRVNPNVEVVETPDQDKTDFTKALEVIEERLHSPEWKETRERPIIVWCENEGRLDQILANLHALYLIDKQFYQQSPVFLTGSSSVTWLLYPGEHTIQPPPMTARSPDAKVGIIPLGSDAKHVILKGFRWSAPQPGIDLSFSTFISACNEFGDEDVCSVKTSERLLFTCECKVWKLK